MTGEAESVHATGMETIGLCILSPLSLARLSQVYGHSRSISVPWPILDGERTAGMREEEMVAASLDVAALW